MKSANDVMNNFMTKLSNNEFIVKEPALSGYNLDLSTDGINDQLKTYSKLLESSLMSELP